MKISWWDRNVKIRYRCLVVIDEFLTVSLYQPNEFISRNVLSRVCYVESEMPPPYKVPPGTNGLPFAPPLAFSVCSINWTSGLFSSSSPVNSATAHSWRWSHWVRVCHPTNEDIPVCVVLVYEAHWKRLRNALYKFSTYLLTYQHDGSVKIIISYLNIGKLLNESTVFWFDWSVGMTDSSHAGSSRKERVCICSMMAGWMVAWLISGDSQATTPTWHWRQKQHASWTKLTQRKCSSL